MTRALLGSSLVLLVAAALSPTISAQEPTNGSPGATAPIDGRQIPPPPGAFGGTINLDALNSKPFWQPQVVPPKGAPNILLIITDDVGFAAPSTFGGVIPTPALDRIANLGLRYTQFHDGAGLGKGGTGIITVDGAEVGRGTFPHTIPFALEASETFDIGSDTGTGVNDADYQTPFAFDGKLNSLTIKLLSPS